MKKLEKIAEIYNNKELKEMAIEQIWNCKV